MNLAESLQTNQHKPLCSCFTPSCPLASLDSRCFCMWQIWRPDGAVSISTNFVCPKVQWDLFAHSDQDKLSTVHDSQVLQKATLGTVDSRKSGVARVPTFETASQRQNFGILRTFGRWPRARCVQRHLEDEQSCTVDCYVFGYVNLPRES